MTKDLSIQLCELCGIERKWIKYTTETTDGCVNLGSRLVYPDFTKPENFVRLFDLPIVNNGTRTVGYFVVYEFTMKTIKDFIECLIIKLERTQFSITKEVKQSIREAEWVYE